MASAALQTASAGNVALVFGASGISGWAVMLNLFDYPTPTTFSRVIGLTNRPMDMENSQLPLHDKRLEVYSGFDLSGELDAVKAQMGEKIPNVEEVTHVYYCAYSNATEQPDAMQIRELNVSMTSNAVNASSDVCPNLKFFVLQTGTNAYGFAIFHSQDKIDITPPVRESQPRVPSPYGDEIFHYGQVDVVKKAHEGKSWKWCEVRPDVIVGFVPAMTAMTFLEPIALFCSLWRYVYGPGAEIKHVGTAANYVSTFNDTSQDIAARSEIYLSVEKPDEADGEAFNTADYTTPTSSVERWPVVVGYFGLKGVAPDKGAETSYPMDKWWEEHKQDYERMVSEYGLRHRTVHPGAWMFTLGGYALLRRDRTLSLDKIRSLGFDEELPVGKGYFLGFDKMVDAKIIPPPEVMQKGA